MDSLDDWRESWHLRRIRVKLPIRWIIGQSLQFSRMSGPSRRALDKWSRELESSYINGNSPYRALLELTTPRTSFGDSRIYSRIKLIDNPEVFPTWDRVYLDRFTTAFMIYLVSKGLLPIGGAAEKLGYVDAQCYLAGRNLLGEFIGSTSMIFGSILTLVWRLWWTRRKQLVKFPQLLLFLYHDYHRIERQVQLQRVVTNLDLVFLHILYRPARLDGGVSNALKLRPNRSHLAHEKLRSSMSSGFQSVVLLSVVSNLLISGVYCYFYTTDHHYAMAYPNCSHIGSHRLYAFVMDVLFLCVVMYDLGLPFAFSIPLLYVLNEDLTIYWASVETNLNRLLGRLRSKTYPIATSIKLWGQKPEMPPGSDWTYSLHLRKMDKELDEMRIEAITLMKDFLAQVRLVDNFARNILTFYTACVIGLYIIVTYILSADISSGYLSFVVMGALITSIVFTGCYAMLMILDRRIMRSYTTMRSIIAHDRSGHRQVFMKICDDYLNRQFAYTCFGYPVTTSALLTFVSWTLSSTVIFTTLNLGYKV